MTGRTLVGRINRQITSLLGRNGRRRTGVAGHLVPGARPRRRIEGGRRRWSRGDWLATSDVWVDERAHALGRPGPTAPIDFSTDLLRAGQADSIGRRPSRSSAGGRRGGHSARSSSPASGGRRQRPCTRPMVGPANGWFLVAHGEWSAARSAAGAGLRVPRSSMRASARSRSGGRRSWQQQHRHAAGRRGGHAGRRRRKRPIVGPDGSRVVGLQVPVPGPDRRWTGELPARRSYGPTVAGSTVRVEVVDTAADTLVALGPLPGPSSPVARSAPPGRFSGHQAGPARALPGRFSGHQAGPMGRVGFTVTAPI